MSYEERSRATAAGAAELTAAQALTRTCNSGRRCPVDVHGCPFGNTPCNKITPLDWLSRIQIEMRHESFCSSC